MRLIILCTCIFQLSLLPAGKETFETKIKSILPEGWKMEVSKKSITIVPPNTAISVAIPSISEDQGLKTSDYYFIIYKSKYLSKKEFDAAQAANKAVSKEQIDILAEIEKREIPFEQLKADRKYLPKNNKDKELVNKYLALNEKIISLPDFYLNGKAYSFPFQSIFPANADVYKEAEILKKRVLAFLNKYE